MTKNRSIYWYAAFGLFIIVAMFVDGGELANPEGCFGSYHVENIWEIWDVAAALWSLTFFFYYYFDYSKTENELLDKWLYLILILSSFALPLSIFYFLFIVHKSALAIILTVALNIVYLFIDGLLAWRHPVIERQRGYREAFLVADVPIVMSNSVFLIWLYFHQEANWSIFASGMVGFQLVSCNIIFVITQMGIVRKIWSNGEQRALT